MPDKLAVKVAKLFLVLPFFLMFLTRRSEGLAGSFTYRVRYLHPCGCLSRCSTASRRVVFFVGFACDRRSKHASHVKTEGCKNRHVKSLFLFKLGTPLPTMNWAQPSFDDPDTLVEEGEGRRPLMHCPPTPRLAPAQDPAVPPLLALPPLWTSVYVAVPSHVHPASLGTFGDHSRAYLPRALRVEVHNFVGWFLQLLVEGRATPSQFRRYVHWWQQRLRWLCQPFQLSWNHAYCIYGVEILDV